MKEKKKSIPQIFLEQFADFLVIILIISAIVSGALGDWESAAVILVVITMNAILGTVQTVKAEHSLNSLKALSAPMAKVIRDGAIREIPGREVTIGDEVLLDAGDFVPADGRLVESASLKVDESALTGESLGVEKITDAVEGEVPLGDRKDMVFSGSFVTYGRGRFPGNGNRYGNRSRKDRRASEECVREKDASAGESGSVRKETVYPDPGILRYSLRCECFPRKRHAFRNRSSLR